MIGIKPHEIRADELDSFSVQAIDKMISELSVSSEEQSNNISDEFISDNYTTDDITSDDTTQHVVTPSDNPPEEFTSLDYVTLSNKVTDIIASSADIIPSSEYIPDITTSSEYIPDIIPSSEYIPDITTSSEHIPDITTSSEHIPDITTPSEHIDETPKSPDVIHPIKNHLRDMHNVFFETKIDKYDYNIKDVLTDLEKNHVNKIKKRRSIIILSRDRPLIKWNTKPKAKTVSIPKKENYDKIKHDFETIHWKKIMKKRESILPKN